MADNAEGSSDSQISFKVKAGGDSNKTHSVTMAESATVLDLKTKLSEAEYENIPVDRQRLIYSGRVMKNDDALATYKIKPGNTIHLVKSAASNPAPPPASAASAPTPQAIPSNMAAGTPANNILAGLTGARFAGHAPLPNSSLFGPDGGMNVPSEEQIADMLSNPAVAASMNEALNNPNFIDFMIQQNPMLRDMPNAREMLQSPLFRQMMTNPEALRAAGRVRDLFGGQGPSDSAFPAPGATDTTPAGAPASGARDGSSAGAQPPPGPNPFSLLGALYGAPGTERGRSSGPIDPANNPFLAMFGAPPAPAAGGAAASANPASPPATAAGNSPASPTAGGQGQAATNPAASAPLPAFGGFGGGWGPTSPQLPPEAIQQLSQMFGRGSSAPPPPVDTRPPEERYAEQLRQLNDMGFYDFDRNIAALRRSGGSVQGAIQHLLGD